MEKNLTPAMLLALSLAATLTNGPISGLEEVPNLALSAKATAFESYGDYTADKANDGKLETRWSGIPGHNTGGWYQLDWPSPVRIAEVIIRQYGSYTHELDVQVWVGGVWKTLNHHGKPGERLRNTVVSRFAQVETTRLRLGNITNGPTFREVEVYSEPFKATKLEIHAASDLRGNIVGIVTDSMGAEPVAEGAMTLEKVESPPRGSAGPSAQFRVDANGMFTIPMRLGMRGNHRIRWSDGKGASVERIVDAADFQHGLTELGHAPKDELLDGTWKFAGDPPAGFERPEFDDSNWRDIEVPAHWEMEGFVVRSGHGGYRREFVLPSAPSANLGAEASPAERLKIRFDGVYSGCAVYCNGVLVARHTGGATPFEADLTDVAKPGRNVLAVDVREFTVASEHLDKMSQYAYFHLAGIWRSVYLFRVPDVHIQRFEWTAKTDGKHGEGTLRIFVANESGKPFRGSAEGTIQEPGSGRPLGLTTADVKHIDVPAGGSESTIRGFGFDAVKPWTAETPNLYEAHLVLRDNQGKVIQTLTQRVGFRETTIRGTQILVNGTPVKFKGACHHDQHPLKGRAVSADDTRLDLEMMKEANLNAVRTSHYPPHPSLPEIADELGLYVEAEAPFCWTDVSNDLRYAPLILQLTAETIQRDRNHPSVTWWSLANESEYGWGFERAREWAKRADPSRPHSAATSADLDIATLHNPLALSRIQDAETKYTKPLIFDESLCVFQGIWGDVAEMWVDPGIRDYYVTPYKPVMDAFLKSRVTQGSFIWAWSDDIFCVPNRGLEYGRETTRSHFVEPSYLMPGRGLVGDAPWGVVDGWRRRKPEFWHIWDLHSGVSLVEVIEQTPERLTLTVRNGFDFIDLAECRFTMDLGQGVPIVGRGRGAPRQLGTVEFDRIPQNGLTRRVALVQVASPTGARVATLPILIDGSAEPPVALDPLPSSPLTVASKSDLSGAKSFAYNDGFEFSVDRATGLLGQFTVLGQAVMLELPQLHLLPTGSALQPLPARNSWRLSGFSMEKRGDGVRVEMQGSYPQFTGSFTFDVAPDGIIEVASEFRYSGEDFFAREAGLRFSVPLACDTLRWSRIKGEDPLDRLIEIRGETRPFLTREFGGPPAHSWDQDPSPMGINAFRSTKRHITMAKITYPPPTTNTKRSRPSPGVQVLSDGSQHLRAMVESDRISVHVNEFYGGTGAGLWEWELNYGKGKLIKKGDVIRSKLRLRLVGG